MEAEVAAAQGIMTFRAFFDCEKCYDNITINALLTEGSKHGQIGRLVALAVHQYTGTRRVRWAGAMGAA
eukprot:9438175-Heterocapsa_arctica.AAC.1